MAKYYLLIMILIIQCKSEFTYDENVMILDESNFEEAMDEFEYMMIDFYAPWCDHCKKMEPEYQKAASDLKDEGIVLAKMDSIKNRKIADAQGVKGYPTIQFITQGKKFDFDGHRNTEGFKSFIIQHINPGTSEYNTTEQIQEYVSQNDVVFFYFADYQSKDSKDREFRRFIEFSYTIKNTHFGHTHNKEIRDFYNVPKNVNLVALKNNGDVVLYTSQLKIPSMKIFIDMNKIERILQWNEWIEENIFLKDKPALVYFETENQQNEEEFIKCAKEYPSEEYLLFVKVNQDLKQSLATRLQIREEDAQGVFMISKQGTQKFKFTNIYQKNNLIAFIKEWKDGKASRYFKTQTNQQSSGPVQILTGESYLSEVLYSSKDAIVLYYSSKNQEQFIVIQFKNNLTKLPIDYQRINYFLQKQTVARTKLLIIPNDQVDDLTETLEVTKIRLYKGVNKERNFAKFILRANKLQEDRLAKWIKDNAQTSIDDPKADL